MNKDLNTIRIETLGCRLNQIESEAAAQYFLKKDFCVQMTPVCAQSDPDENTILAIINTCTVTQKAEQKARRIIRLLLKKYENSTIIVTGCYAQLSKEEIQNIDKRIAVIGGQIKSRISKIPDLLKDFLQNNTWNPESFVNQINTNVNSIPQTKIDFPENSFELAATSFLAHSRASLKIQDGCNNSCSYCAIHIARGHSVSLDVQTAINRVRELEKEGHKEVVLTTINIGQYRGEFKNKEGQTEYYNFSKLLKSLLENSKTINFRISSLYPEIVNDEFCEVIKDERVCPHFHISVQSGSDKILKLMNRHYISEDVVQACKKIRAVKENPFLACDIITGFPGETDEDFEQTLDLCNKCKFTWIHAFPFSERKGTPACQMNNKVPQSISGKRAEILTKWAIKSKVEYINLFKGKILTGILETVKKSQVMDKRFTKYHVVTKNFLHCEVLSDQIKEPRNTVQIKIISPLQDRIIKGGEIEASAEFI